MACTGVDEDGNVTTEEGVTCTVFGGTPGFCKEAVGGVQNCCEPVGGIGIGTYITLIKATADLNSALDDMSKVKEGGFLKDIGSSWVDMKGDVAGVVKDGWSWVGENFSGFADNISGLTDSISSAFTKLVDFKKEVMSQIQSKCQEIMTQIFKDCGMDGLGEAAAGSAVGEGSKEAGSEAAGQAASVVQGLSTVFTVVSWIYTAYVVATMIIQIVYACEDVEYETVSNNKMGNCHRIGTYCKSKVLGVCIENRTTCCCYKSPLSRIMNEQIRLQGDILGEEFNDFGSVENPRCDGIPLDRVGEVDWDRIDLSEWIAILERTGNLPNDDTISIDSLTGTGSKMDTDGTRLNTIDRTYPTCLRVRTDREIADGENDSVKVHFPNLSTDVVRPTPGPMRSACDDVSTHEEYNHEAFSLGTRSGFGPGRYGAGRRHSSRHSRRRRHDGA